MGNELCAIKTHAHTWAINGLMWKWNWNTSPAEWNVTLELLARISAVWKFSVLFLKVISSVNHYSHRDCVRVNVTQSSYSPCMLYTQSQGKQYFVHILLLPKNYEKYSVCVRKCVWGLTHGTQRDTFFSNFTKIFQSILQI